MSLNILINKAENETDKNCEVEAPAEDHVESKLDPDNQEKKEKSDNGEREKQEETRETEKLSVSVKARKKKKKKKKKKTTAGDAQLLLQMNPYHIDSLLQLSDVCRIQDDQEMAKDLIGLIMGMEKRIPLEQ
ncbi:UNVERIFIED_CONTAM: hypothetical protein FKN15_066717 [Acipenser sinensis]